MTIQQDAYPDDQLPAAGHRAGGGGDRWRLAFLWGAVAVLAAGGVWAVATPHSADPPAGTGQTNTQADVAAALPGQPVPPLTEGQSFGAERYFPAQRAFETEAYKARRSAARDGADCQAVQADKARNALGGLDCQGWIGVALTRTDQPVISSVTVLRFADPAAAAKALPVVREQAAAFEFTYPDGLTAPAGSAKPMAATRVELAGHHLTITVSRYADQRPGTTADEVLTASTRAAAAFAGQPFMWM